MALVKKLRKAKKDAPDIEKPKPVRSHLCNMIIVPEMIGSIIEVYNGKTFNQAEIKPKMIGDYLAEFSISYKPVKHERPRIGAPTHPDVRAPPLSWLRKSHAEEDGLLSTRFYSPVPTQFLENILEITGHRLTPYNQIDDYGQEKNWKNAKVDPEEKKKSNYVCC